MTKGIKENKSDQEAQITPAAFTPITEETAQKGFSINPLKIIVGFALFISLIILWFLLSAKSVVVTVEPNHSKVNISGGITFELADHYLIRPGDYVLEAQAEGYLDLEQPFTVTDDEHQLLALEMEKKPGHLKVTTNPKNAEIVVAGEVVGTSPMTISPLTPGIHQLEINAPRYFSETASVDIEGLDRTQSLHMDLKPAWGFGQFSTSPAGASVLIKDKLI